MLNKLLRQVQQDIPEDGWEELNENAGGMEGVKDSFKICDSCATKMKKSQENVQFALNICYILPLLDSDKQRRWRDVERNIMRLLKAE